MSIDDDPWVQGFEARTLPARAFDHAAHLRVAWALLRTLPFEDAAPRFVRGLRAYADANGVGGKFHATVTWAYLALVAERLADPALAALSFEAFVARAPELAGRAALEAMYPPGALASETARRVFVLPRAPATAKP
jgi:hypothetical protein